VFEKVEEEAAIINTFLNSKNLEYKPSLRNLDLNQSPNKQASSMSMKELIEQSRKLTFLKKEQKNKTIDW
jgi:hypothetical protein